MFNKNKIKEELTIEEVFDYVAEIGGHPKMIDNDSFSCETLCHNHPGEGSHKLYYYDNTKLFRCYTECNDSFDIFELVQKIRRIERQETSLYLSVKEIAQFFGIATEKEKFERNSNIYNDFEYFENCNKISENKHKEKEISFKKIDRKVLQFLPRRRFANWRREGIQDEVCDARLIAYDPVEDAILIPHFDGDGDLIGIRQRTLIKENEIFGKYRPAKLNNILYNHPLGLALYNLNWSKNNIRDYGVAIVFEGEKSCLKYASYFGLENDISVAVCGNSLVNYQVELLLQSGAKEIVIAFDKQFQDVNSEEGKKWIKKLKDINKKYSNRCQISFMFDKGSLLDYKDSPIDKTPEIFLKLFKERIIL